MNPFPLITIGDGIRETREWACVLTRTASAQTKYLGFDLAFYAGAQLLGRLHPSGRLDIMDGYACDGYSPTLRIFGRWFRLTHTPSKAGMFPAIRHDFSRQFSDTEGCPWKREDTDVDFYDDLVTAGQHPHFSGIYFSAVSGTIGNTYHHFRKQDPTLWIQAL